MIVHIELAPGEELSTEASDRIVAAVKESGVRLDFYGTQHNYWHPHYLDTLGRYGYRGPVHSYLDRPDVDLDTVRQQDRQLRHQGWEPKSEFVYPARELAEEEK